MKNLSLIAFICILSCKAQDSSLVKKDQDFYLKSHELLDDVLNKGTLTYALIKTFDFKNNRNLTESQLFDKIYYFNPISLKEIYNIEITKDDFKRSKEKSGWITGSKNETRTEWDLDLFVKSKVNFVDAHPKVFLYTVDGVNYFNVIPLNINFKEDLAMVEYKGAFGKELEIYKLIDGKWYLMAGATDEKISRE